MNAKLLRGLGVSCTFSIGMAFAGCGSDDADPKPKGGALGATCDVDTEGTCDADLICSPRGDSAVCTYAAGQSCTPEHADVENGGCPDTAECKAPTSGTEGSGTGAAGAGGETEADPVCLIRKGEICDPDSVYCDSGLVCAELESGEHRCFEPLVFRGEVTDSSNGDPIGDAQVIAIDDEGVAVSDIAVTNALGNYELAVPVLRNDDGSPVTETFTLRAAAQTYQPFPKGVRVALPISTTEAELDEAGYSIDSALTDIALIPLETSDLSWISGQVVGLEGSDGVVAGVLVVANDGDTAVSAITDRSGAFTIFNVPTGDFEIKGYAAGIQIESESVEVPDGGIEGVKLMELAEGTTSVSGSVQLVDPKGYRVTSVILVVEDTFDPNMARGEVPRGLRAPKHGDPSVEGAWTIEDVPAGKYVALAAYENDGLVRDPDTSIGGTEFVHIEVLAGEQTQTLSEGFKVTGALETLAPGSDEPEEVTEKPTLTWADDSSEEWYEVRVFDAFGDEVWSNLMVPSVSGAKEVTLAYEGPLEPGMYYQFRVTSWAQSGNSDPAPKSTTEDLRGVFYLPAQ